MVTSLNIDANRETALKLCIHSIPTLVLFKNGKEIQRFIGLQSEKLLSQAIENVLG
jgi:thioredoxin 1